MPNFCPIALWSWCNQSPIALLACKVWTSETVGPGFWPWQLRNQTKIRSFHGLGNCAHRWLYHTVVSSHPLLLSILERSVKKRSRWWQGITFGCKGEVRNTRRPGAARLDWNFRFAKPPSLPQWVGRAGPSQISN